MQSRTNTLGVRCDVIVEKGQRTEMGALPKKRISRGRRNRRRAQDGLEALNLIACPQSHELRLPHRVCPSCGHYRGVEVVEISEEE